MSLYQQQSDMTPSSSHTTTIYLTNNGLHTYLVLPATAVTAQVPALEAHFPDTAWLQVGWGDYHYYGNPEQTKWMGFKALCLPTKAVIGLMAINNPRTDLPKSIRLFEHAANPKTLNAVVAFVCNHIQSNHQPEVIRVRDDGELFFLSVGTYSIFNTCNHWTAKALQSAGLEVNPRVAFSPYNVEKQATAKGFNPVI